jgi:hypothetical protein
MATYATPTQPRSVGRRGDAVSRPRYAVSRRALALVGAIARLAREIDSLPTQA